MHRGAIPGRPLTSATTLFLSLRISTRQRSILGFDFYRDPLNAKKPMQTFQEIMQADIAQKGYEASFMMSDMCLVACIT